MEKSKIVKKTDFLSCEHCNYSWDRTIINGYWNAYEVRIYMILKMLYYANNVLNVVSQNVDSVP